MGKTSQRLTIWVAPEWREHEKIQELATKGHTLKTMQADAAGLWAWDGDTPDLILHPAAHQWDDSMWIYLENALKTARKRKYPKVRRKEK